jgi:Spy/CpxP family protein refolding chaperone
VAVKQIRIPYRISLRNSYFEELRMTPPVRRRLLVAFAVLALGSPAMPRATQAQSFAWWKSPELGLSTEQRAQIEKIFEATRPELLQEWEELDRQEAKLSRQIENDADEAMIARQITRVEMARASANQTRSLMFVRMRKVLTPEQRDLLKALQERREANRRSGAGPGRQNGPETHRRPEF